MPVALAPMAGVTDAPFRAAVRSFGPTLVYSEMVASKELLRDRKSAALRLKAAARASSFAIQLAGRDADSMAEAARLAEAEGAAFIDINMGCPAKKVVGGLCGSALMREPELAIAIARAVVGAVHLPVTVKMRLGWDDQDRNAPVLASQLEREGVQAVSVHGRTRCQFYEGSADWQFISEVKARVSIPVLANGDVTSPEAAKNILQASKADGVLVGRGSFGQPWAMMQMQDAVWGNAIRPEPSDREKWRVALEQYRGSLAHYGDDLGRRVIRKHLGWYAERMSSGKEIRDALVRSQNAEHMLEQLSNGEQAIAA
ncbi:MAG: tRNA dihydrouridine synthase DusB [Micropepsaceae bacterium]